MRQLLQKQITSCISFVFTKGCMYIKFLVYISFIKFQKTFLLKNIFISFIFLSFVKFEDSSILIFKLLFRRHNLISTSTKYTFNMFCTIDWRNAPDATADTNRPIVSPLGCGGLRSRHPSRFPASSAFSRHSSFSVLNDTSLHGSAHPMSCSCQT